jgi:hypothetical protein
MAGGLQQSSARIRVGLRAAAVGCVWLLASCIGGPHPLPPGGERASTGSTGVTGPATLPTTPIGAAPNAPPAAMSPAGAAATPPVTAPPSAAAGSGASQPQAPASPTMGGAAGSGFSTPAGSAGTPAPGAPTTPPPASAGSGGSGGSAATDGSVCDGATAPLSALELAPRNLLFVLDRSVEMAGDFHGAPRWQLASQALMHTLSPRANDLTLGALLYPSSARADCTAPDWLCSLQPQPMCTVNPMASADQIAFQPAAQALGMLLGSDGIYTPVMAGGVPLGESLQRADTALSAQPLNGETAVVIVASGVPTCSWDAAKARETIARWKTQRGVQTYVVTLPGSPEGISQALAGLAEAGGTGNVRTPTGAGSLEATLQSIVFDSLSSCVLKLDPPAADPSSVQVLVTQGGVERSLPRTSPSGEPQWMISADGAAVTLLGGVCDSASRGAYEALRIVLSCARP